MYTMKGDKQIPIPVKLTIQNPWWENSYSIEKDEKVIDAITKKIATDLYFFNNRISSSIFKDRLSFYAFLSCFVFILEWLSF